MLGAMESQVNEAYGYIDLVTSANCMATLSHLRFAVAIKISRSTQGECSSQWIIVQVQNEKLALAGASQRFR
jgi:hypothetical protein